MVRPFCVLQQDLCPAGRRGVQDDAIYCNGNCGLPGQRFSVNNHKFGAPVGSWKIKHANPRCLLGERKIVLSQQLADGSSVGPGILGLHRLLIGETFDVMDELQSAESSEYDEIEIARWLLLNDRGMDVNARAEVDSDGVGGHTPLFGCVVSQPYRCGMQRDAAFTRCSLTTAQI